MKVEMKNVTIVAIDCKNYGLAVNVLQDCLEKVEVERCIFLTDIDIEVDGIEVIKIPSVNSKNDYSFFIIKELHKHFDTSHCLIVQYDSAILNSECWDDDFLNYDYIGARWLYPITERCVGNGGLSIRSKRLMEILATDDFIKCTEQEDDAICRLYGEYLEDKYDIKFAPYEVADKFAFELVAPTQKTFGHHGYFHNEFKEHIVLKRTGALGDLIMLCPVMEYFNNKGYQVVLDTLPQFMALFYEHYFPVMHISKMDKNIKPIREINFDMAYEVTPKQLVLKSYYDIAGITDEPFVNSKLNISRGGTEKMFKKYVVVHIDQTGIPHREINEVDWNTVVRYLEKKGYTVFQIGKREHEEIATYFNTMSIELLMYFIKHADLFIGADSGNAHIAVAFNLPCVIFSGSVNLKYRYANFERIRVVQNECDRAGCYHETVGEKGQDCYYNKFFPPCCNFTSEQVINAINKLV